MAELAAEEDCHTRTIWRDLAAIQAAGLALFPTPIDSHEVKLLKFHGRPAFSPENLCVESFDMLQKRVECVQIDRHVQGPCPVC